MATNGKPTTVQDAIPDLGTVHTALKPAFDAFGTAGPPSGDDLRGGVTAQLGAVGAKVPSHVAEVQSLSGGLGSVGGLVPDDLSAPFTAVEHAVGGFLQQLQTASPFDPLHDVE